MKDIKKNTPVAVLFEEHPIASKATNRAGDMVEVNEYAQETITIIKDSLEEKGLDWVITDGCIDGNLTIQVRAMTLPVITALLKHADEAETDVECMHLMRQASDGIESLIHNVLSDARKNCSVCLQECAFREEEPIVSKMHIQESTPYIEPFEVTREEKKPSEKESGDTFKQINWFGE